MNVHEAFPTWNPTEHHLWQLLKYLQFILQHPIACISGDNPPQKISNEEASDWLQQNKIDEFSEKSREIVRISKDAIYDAPPTDDKHYIKFSLFDDEIHRNVLEQIKYKNENKSSSPVPTGLSWVNEGEFKPLSK